MKLKKLLAVVLSAVMAVSVLSACGGSGIGGSRLTGQVNGLLNKVNSSAVVTLSEELNEAVAKVASEKKVNTAAVYGSMWAEMGIDWPLKGTAFAISDEKLESGNALDYVVKTAEGLEWLGVDNEAVNGLTELGDRKIDTPEELAAALVLMADTYYQGSKEYSVAVQAVENDDTQYWIFALLVNDVQE